MGLEKEYLEHNKVKMPRTRELHAFHTLVDETRGTEKKYDERDGEVCP